MDDLEPRGEPRPAPASAAPPDEPTPRNNRRRSLLAALLALLVFGGTFAVLTRGPHNAAIDPTPAVRQTPADTDAPFPSDTASDVVSYADHVAVVTAIAEGEGPSQSPPPRGTFPPGETAAWRQITFRVDDTLWSRADAPPAPKQFTALTWGWLIKGDQRRPFTVSGTPHVFVDAHYLVPIAYDGTTFTAIQPFAVFPFHTPVVRPERDQDTALARQLDGATRDQITDIFANAVPDPLAVRYRHLRPRARLAAVIAARTP